MKKRLRASKSSGLAEKTQLGCIRIYPPSMTGWWLTYPPEKYESQWEGLSNILWKNRKMFQTTNQMTMFNRKHDVLNQCQWMDFCYDVQRCPKPILRRIHLIRMTWGSLNLEPIFFQPLSKAIPMQWSPEGSECSATGVNCCFHPLGAWTIWRSFHVGKVLVSPALPGRIWHRGGNIWLIAGWIS